MSISGPWVWCLSISAVIALAPLAFFAGDWFSLVEDRKALSAFLYLYAFTLPISTILMFFFAVVVVRLFQIVFNST
ncbi:MAG: hypothetical protein AAGA47_05540 [Pseudomonadota bacterium]